LPAVLQSNEGDRLTRDQATKISDAIGPAAARQSHIS
jgi:hypothetical protein